jgi:hypothetical protein
MKKRIKKKKAEYSCPRCGCRDGIVGHFQIGKKWKQLFLYCASKHCKWEYKLNEED